MTPKVRAAWEKARAAWPSVEVAEEQFVSYAARRVDLEDVAGDDEPDRVRDLYLACACAHGNEAALREFERTYFSEIARSARRMRTRDLGVVRQ
jgi:RNA polymerase sigma-70 factor (ECF subfamily)